MAAARESSVMALSEPTWSSLPQIQPQPWPCFQPLITEGDGVCANEKWETRMPPIIIEHVTWRKRVGGRMTSTPRRRHRRRSRGVYSRGGGKGARHAPRGRGG